MIDRDHDLPVSRQAKALGISRSAVYYKPRATPAADLQIIRRHYSDACMFPVDVPQIENRACVTVITLIDLPGIRPARAGDFLRHARLPAVEHRQRPVDRVAHVAACSRVDRGAILEGAFDEGLQLGVGHERFRISARRGFFAGAVDVNGGGRARPSPLAGEGGRRSRPDEGSRHQAHSSA